jgi:hypothetical protein
VTTQQEQREWGAGRVHPVTARKNGYATASLVLGAIGLPTAFFVIGGVFGVMAITLGLLGLGAVKRDEADYRGVAIAGIACGALATVNAALMVAVVYRVGGT